MTRIVSARRFGPHRPEAAAGAGWWPGGGNGLDGFRGTVPRRRLRHPARGDEPRDRHGPAPVALRRWRDPEGRGRRHGHLVPAASEIRRRAEPDLGIAVDRLLRGPRRVAAGGSGRDPRRLRLARQRGGAAGRGGASLQRGREDVGTIAHRVGHRQAGFGRRLLDRAPRRRRVQPGGVQRNAPHLRRRQHAVGRGRHLV